MLAMSPAIFSSCSDSADNEILNEQPASRIVYLNASVPQSRANIDQHDGDNGFLVTSWKVGDKVTAWKNASTEWKSIEFTYNGTNFVGALTDDVTSLNDISYLTHGSCTGDILPGNGPSFFMPEFVNVGAEESDCPLINDGAITVSGNSISAKFKVATALLCVTNNSTAAKNFVMKTGATPWYISNFLIGIVPYLNAEATKVYAFNAKPNLSEAHVYTVPAGETKYIPVPTISPVHVYEADGTTLIKSASAAFTMGQIYSLSFPSAELDLVGYTAFSKYSSAGETVTKEIEIDANTKVTFAADSGIKSDADDWGVYMRSGNAASLTLSASNGKKITKAIFTFLGEEKSPSFSDNNYDAANSTPGIVVSGNTATYDGTGVDKLELKFGEINNSIALTNVKVWYE